MKSRLIVGAVAGAIIVTAIVGARIYFSNQKVPPKSSSDQDHHVMRKRDWTLDQLVGWLERWEPSELD